MGEEKITEKALPNLTIENYITIIIILINEIKVKPRRLPAPKDRFIMRKEPHYRLYLVRG